MRSKYMKRILTVTATISSIVIGCQVGPGKESIDSTVSDFSEAKNCGLLATVGETSSNLNVAGRFAQLPSAIAVKGQIIACGNVALNSDENWHAIGVGVERRTVMIQDRAAGTTVEAQPVIQQDGSIALYANNALVLKMGSVPSAEVGMPIGLDSGLTFEIRSGANKVDLVSAKQIANEQMTLWIIK